MVIRFLIEKEFKQMMRNVILPDCLCNAPRWV